MQEQLRLLELDLICILQILLSLQLDQPRDSWREEVSTIYCLEEIFANRAFDEYYFHESALLAYHCQQKQDFCG